MKKLLLFVISALLLTCCTTTQTITHTNTIVVSPPDALFVCPDLPILPHGKVTDVQNGQFITGLAQTAIACKQELNNVKTAINNEKKIIEDNKVKDTITK